MSRNLHAYLKSYHVLAKNYSAEDENKRNRQQKAVFCFVLLFFAQSKIFDKICMQIFRDFREYFVKFRNSSFVKFMSIPIHSFAEIPFNSFQRTQRNVGALLRNTHFR